MAVREQPHAGHRERLREKYLETDGNGLSEAELLELLLFYSTPRVDTRPMAEALIRAFGSLDGVLASDPKELHSFAHLTASTDVLFHLIGKFQERATSAMRESCFAEKGFLRSYLPAQFAGFDKEHAILFYLNTDGTVIKRQTVIGDADGFVRLSVRRFVETAVRLHASSIILSHNHPNRKALPSGADLDSTEKFLSLCNRNGLDFVEHYIVAGDDCYPILENHAHLRKTVAKIDSSAIPELMDLE